MTVGPDLQRYGAFMCSALQKKKKEVSVSL